VKEIGRWRVARPDGDFEEYVLEKAPDGSFRIRNDFGNVQIDMDPMSGIEFLKRAKSTIERNLDGKIFSNDDDLDLDFFDNIFNNDDSTDCNGDT
tara:strand:+ start:165 stop:449 length:285 start_codon:yes stop_codon:yes gene_type:complete